MPPRGYQKKQNVHKCQYCTYVTHRRSFMNDHIRVHTGEKPFSCDTCGKAFSQKSNLRQHLKVHNQGNNTYHCCKLCDFKTKWKSSLQVHERMHKGEKPYKCKICDRAFSQSTHCQTHMREAHLNMRNFQCDICSKTFKRHEHLERHLAFHKEERNFECDVCHKKYLDARYLKQHKLIHEGEASKIHQCSLCSYKSRYRQGLKIHTRTHTGLRPYSCKECSKAFVTGQSLKLHHRMVHQGLAGRIFHCNMCNFSTANNQNLKQHMLKIHDGQKDRRSFKCQYCSSLHNNRSSLNSHMAKIHAKQLNDSLTHKLRPLSRTPIKVIGSLSPTGGATGSNQNMRRSPESKLKLHLKAESSKPGSFVPVKTEDNQTESTNDQAQNCGGLTTAQEHKGGKIQKQTRLAEKEKMSTNSVLSEEKEAPVFIRKGDKMANSNKQGNRKQIPHSANNKAPKGLKIKLNLPKHKKRSISPRPRSPGSSTGSSSRSPSYDKGSKKSARKATTPSKERARALFVDPQSDVPSQSPPGQSQVADPNMPELQKQTEPLDYSMPCVRRLTNVASSPPKAQPNNQPQKSSNQCIIQMTKPYDSLRDIAAQFLKNNIHSSKQDANKKQNDHPAVANSTPSEKSTTSDVHIKEEPDAVGYMSTTQAQVAPVQETALDMRCVKLE